MKFNGISCTHRGLCIKQPNGDLIEAAGLRKVPDGGQLVFLDTLLQVFPMANNKYIYRDDDYGWIYDSDNYIEYYMEYNYDQDL